MMMMMMSNNILLHQVSNRFRFIGTSSSFAKHIIRGDIIGGRISVSVSVSVSANVNVGVGGVVVGGVKCGIIINGRRSFCLFSSKFTSSSSSLPSSSSSSLPLPSWATIDPSNLGKSTEPYYVPNLVQGEWQDDLPSHPTKKVMHIPDPMNKNNYPIFQIPDTQIVDLEPYIQSMKLVSKSGLHNPFNNVDRYLLYGEISRRAGEEMSKPETINFFANCIMKCVPKSYAQAVNEVHVTANFLKNFGGDNVRFLANNQGIPGDFDGQYSNSYRWPYGPVCIISPFNFPLEIPVLQLMGALYMGNKPILKQSEKTSLVMEQFIRLLHYVNMPKVDVDLLNCKGFVVQELLHLAPIRLTQFTGSSKVGELLSKFTNGKVKLEDAGFDWKILGPDVDVDVDVVSSSTTTNTANTNTVVKYVAWQCDQDAYAAQGQKCSAQSILFAHENWIKAGIIQQMKQNASKRNLNDLTIGPVLTHTTESILNHIEQLLYIPGSKIIFGGKGLMEHDIPEIYGVVEPTAVFIPIEELIKDEYFDLCTKELFAPFQIITKYNDKQMNLVLKACELMSHHLTAAIVSNDLQFQHTILSNTVNGTTYVGLRARTTGAPQNHWFGPAGDPRGAGIGTPEAIKLVWSCHREIIHDLFIPQNWEQPKAS